VGPSAGIIIGDNFKTDFSLQVEILYYSAGFNQQYTVINHDQTFDYTLTPPQPVDTSYTYKHSNTLNLTYLYIPILFKKSFSFKGGVIPYSRETSIFDFDIFAGPYFSYLLSSSANMSTTMSYKYYQGGTYQTGTLARTSPDRDYTAGNSFGIGGKVTIASGDTSAIPNNPAFLAQYIKPSTVTASNGMSSIDAGLVFGLGFSMEIGPSSKLSIDARYSMGFLSIDNTYFNNVAYIFKQDPNGTIIINSNKVSYTETRTKMNLTNSGMGVFLSYIHYVK
jgi:hypothetical protein